MSRRKQLRELLYRIRTEGLSPGEQAGAVALGVFIGCSPFYGLHLALCILFAKLFRLNQGLTYLAAHISLPGVWPLLVFAQLQLGRWLRGRPLLSIRPSELKMADISLKQFGLDLLLGATVVGAVLAALFELLTLWAARKRRAHPDVEGLLEEAGRRYLDAGMFHWEFVRGKLRHDPLYFNLLRRGFLPSEGRLLDLGCGRGILFSLLLAARDRHARGEYPKDWPPPPRLAFHGIERGGKTAAAARRALGDEAVVVTADLRDAAFPEADAVVILDVLHYLPANAQENLLDRAAKCLAPGGVLLIRDADAAGGCRFSATRIQERTMTLLRGHWRQRFQYRSAAEWRGMLEDLGLTVDVQPMGMGTPYANVLLAGRKLPQDLRKDLRSVDPDCSA
jgi:uncharacterized protein (DUF2062 family)